MKEGQIPGFQRFLSAGIDKDIEFAALTMMNNQRPVRLPLQLIIFAQRQDPQNASPVQGQQPTYGLRRNGGVVIDKYPSEATAEATAVRVVELRHHGFNRLMQAQNGIAPGHRVVFALIALHLLQIALRPLKGVMGEAVGKPGVGDTVRRQLTKPDRLAPVGAAYSSSLTISSKIRSNRASLPSAMAASRAAGVAISSGSHGIGQ